MQLNEARPILPFGETGEYREFSPDEILEATLFGLRTIRAICDKKVGFASPTSLPCQEYIADAEVLGLTTADYLLHPFGENGTVEQRNAWLSTIDRISGKYGYNLLSVITNSFSRSRDITLPKISSSLNFLIALTRDSSGTTSLKDLEKYILERDTTALSAQDLCCNNLIVFSPLSLDYLIACLFHKYTQQFLSADCFRLKPLILSSHSRGHLRVVAMPDLKDDNYAEVTKTKIFVENNFSGETMRVSREAVHRYYG
ncbi:MAG: hypothetical protein A3C22_02255 [Candidatus Levybacteria bacterium RIFCSPHIGHO2_02_FULL_37_10]|nr:MAG: hypothetical protein A3C22_02255 [Candidatus Levybacteria bacterium RIFCSPHIGHO2_02_FULL_37_10]